MPTRPDRRLRDLVPRSWRSALGGDGGLPIEVLDAVPDPFLVVDEEGRVEVANWALTGVLGHDIDALVGADLVEALAPPRLHRAYRDRLRSAADDAPIAPLAVLHADGTEVAVELSLRALPDARVAVCLRIAQADLAAARDAAEGRLRVLRTIVDALPEAVVAVNRAGRIVFRNPASTEVHGTSADDERALPPRQWHEAAAVLQSGEPALGQEEAGPDGRIWRTDRVPIRDAQGAVVGLVAISSDVTDQKAEEARLRDEKHAAEAAAHANREFLATTSHEVRTLMSGVTGMTALLLGTELDDEQRDFIETVRTSSDALLRVINDVLDLSKMEAGRFELEDRPFDVRGAVRTALGMVTQQAAAKGLKLEGEVADDVPETVHGDPARIQQVLVNLLSNAVKFTDEGAVLVRVDRAGRAALAFAVEDTGAGIAPDRLDAVFEPFAQADRSTARTHGGTGLGLTICRRLVGAMGGELTAASEVGQGSVFRFTVAVDLPADAADETSAPAPAPSVPAEADEAPLIDVPLADMAPAGGDGALGDGAPPDEPSPPDRAVVMSTDAMLPGARVLLAEDNPMVGKVTTLTLRRLGYRPDVVVDGAKAVMSVRARPYDVVLMDIMMPVMDGLEATRQIRADPGRHPMPAIVALTANAMAGDRQKCLDAGCDDYLSKPVDPQQLAATIERAIREREAAPAA